MVSKVYLPPFKTPVIVRASIERKWYCMNPEYSMRKHYTITFDFTFVMLERSEASSALCRLTIDRFKKILR
jgi:hypothetical protein